MDALDKEQLVEIAKFLDYKDQLSMALVCTTFHRALSLKGLLWYDLLQYSKKIFLLGAERPIGNKESKEMSMALSIIELSLDDRNFTVLDVCLNMCMGLALFREYRSKVLSNIFSGLSHSYRLFDSSGDSVDRIKLICNRLIVYGKIEGLDFISSISNGCKAILSDMLGKASNIPEACLFVIDDSSLTMIYNGKRYILDLLILLRSIVSHGSSYLLEVLTSQIEIGDISYSTTRHKSYKYYCYIKHELLNSKIRCGVSLEAEDKGQCISSMNYRRVREILCDIDCHIDHTHFN